MESIRGAQFAIAVPLVGGVLADHWGYPPVFIITGITGVLALLAFEFWVPSRREPAEVGVGPMEALEKRA